MTSDAIVAEGHRPFRWVLIDPALRPALASGLAASFPTAELEEARAPDEMFQLRETLLVRNDDVDGPLLRRFAPPWSELVEFVLDASFRRTLGELAGVDTLNTFLNLRVVEYEASSWLGPHTDHPSRVVTDVIYLSPSWDPSWGGSLRLLGSCDAADVVAEIPPRFNTAMVLRRDDRSFHAVRPVDAQAPTPRRVVVIQLSDRQLAR